jgi:hypothetical protein
VAAGNVGAERRQLVEDCQAGTDRALGVLLLRVRIAEINQDAIAHELGDIAVEAPDSFADPLLIGADHIAHVLGIEPRRELRRIRQVAEHHGQVASLSGWQVAIGGRGMQPFGLPQGRQGLRQRGQLGSGRAPLMSPDEKFAIEIRR